MALEEANKFRQAFTDDLIFDLSKIAGSLAAVLSVLSTESPTITQYDQLYTTVRTGFNSMQKIINASERMDKIAHARKAPPLFEVVR